MPACLPATGSISMISGRTPRQTALRVLVLVCALLPDIGLTAEPWRLPELLAALARHGDSRVDYVETRTIALLKQPLRLEGFVEFRHPAYLAKHVLKPSEEHYVIDGDNVTVTKPGDPAITLSLSSHPALEAFTASLRAPLAGDSATLNRYYQISLGGSRQHWLLALAPRRSDMAALVRLVKLEGRGDRLESLSIEEASGDLSTLRFRHRSP